MSQGLVDKELALAQGAAQHRWWTETLVAGLHERALHRWSVSVCCGEAFPGALLGTV